ncbi:MAG TPA: hypothetical protein VKI19_00385 [Acidimicrobiales bacterium]|nr:hypothetical protein [Acidimicrobiales bacterium]
MFGWHVPAPDGARPVSGRMTKAADLPFRIVTGHGTFVVPVWRRASILGAADRSADTAQPGQ